jgi:hypothetical protein
MTLISILLKASILLLAAALPTVLFRRRTSAATRHFIWMLVVVGLLLLPVFSLLLPSWTAFTTPAGTAFAPARLEQNLIRSSRETEETRLPRVPSNAAMEQPRPELRNLHLMEVARLQILNCRKQGGRRGKDSAQSISG